MADLDFSSQAEPVSTGTLDFSSAAEPVRKVGALENLGRQFTAGGGDVLNAMQALGDLGNKLIPTPGLFSTSGPNDDVTFGTLGKKAQESVALAPNEVPDGMTARITGGAGRMLPSMAAAIGTGGESSLAGLVPDALRTVPYLGRFLTSIGAGAPTAGVLTGEQAANLPDTMSAGDKATTVAKDLGVNLAMAGLPMAVGASPFTRVLTGGALGYGGSAAASAVQGQPQDQANNIVGGMMGALLGQHSAEVPAAPLDPYIARYNANPGEAAAPVRPEGPALLPAPDFAAQAEPVAPATPAPEATPAAPAVPAPEPFNPKMAETFFKADPRTALAALDHPMLVQVAKDAGFDVGPGEGAPSIIGKIVSQPTAFIHSDVLPEYMAAVTPAVASRPIETNPVVSQEAPNPVDNVPPQSMASLLAPNTPLAVDSAGTAYTPDQGMSQILAGMVPRETPALPAPVTTVDSLGNARDSGSFLRQAQQAQADHEAAALAKSEKSSLGITPDIERTQTPKWEAAKAKAQDIQDKLDARPDDELATQRDDDSPPWWLAGQHAEEELSQQQAPGSRELSTDVETPKAPELPAAPYDMTPEELSAHADAVGGHGKAVEDAVLGDKADEWRAAQRQFQSSNDAIADKGETTFKAIESKLSPKNRDLLYGIGESDQAHDDLQDFRDAHQDAATAGTPEEATAVLSRFLPTLGNTKGGDPAQWTRKQQVAYAGMRTLREQIAENGWDSSTIQKNALHRAASRYSDSTDMETMLDRFMKTEPRKTEQSTAPALDAPAGRTKAITHTPPSELAQRNDLHQPDGATGEQSVVPPADRRDDYSPRIERHALTEIQSLVDRFGGSTLADSIAQDFHEHQGAALVGQKITSHEDLAALGSVYRNPAFETMRYIYVDDAGNVLGETAVSSRMPSTVIAFPDSEKDGPKWVIESAPKGATGVWLAHNHPSADPTPSKQDIDFTGNLSIQLGDTSGAPKVRGHVVLDHDTYGSISAAGEDMGNGKVKNAAPADPLRKPVGENFYGANLASPDFAAGAAQKIAAMTPADSSAVIVMGNQGQVVSVHTFPNDVLATPKGYALMSRIGNKRGAVGIGIVTSSENFAKHYAQFKNAADRRLFYDAVVVNNEGTAMSLGHGGVMKTRSLFGKHTAGSVQRKKQGAQLYEGGTVAEPKPQADILSLSRIRQLLADRGMSAEDIAGMSRDQLRAEQANFRARSAPTPETTGIKNATVAEERAMKGDAEVEHDLSRTDQEGWDRAKARLSADPNYGTDLAASFVKKPRPSTKEETFALSLDRMRISKERRAAYDEAETARTSGTQSDQLRAQQRIDALDAQMEANDVAGRVTGYETASGLAARRALSREDYSMASLVTQGKVKAGRALTSDERSQLEERAKEIEAREAAVAKREADVRGRRRSATTSEKTAASAKARFDDLASQLRKIAAKDQLKPGCVA